MECAIVDAKHGVQFYSEIPTITHTPTVPLWDRQKLV